jgi:iron complex transport system substrate-binding protein
VNKRIPVFVLLCFLAGGGVIAAGPETPPNRVVSLDYCADQFVLKLLPRSRILAVSPDANKHFSYMRESADGVPQVRPLAEDVLSIQPDLVVRSYGGGPNALRFFERAGVSVLQVPYANDIDDIRRSILLIAERLGERKRGQELVAEMDDRLDAIHRSESKNTALYMTPTGFTSGPGTLVHEMLLAAGLDNFEEKAGWRSIPLEQLAYEGPDMVVAAFFDANASHPGMWSAMRHPVARRQMNDRPTVMLEGAWTSCGSWFLLDAIEAIASAVPVTAPR